MATPLILKLARQQATIKILGSGPEQANIDLARLAMSDETFLGYPNTNVSINTVFFASSDSNAVAPILIQRPYGSNNLILHGTDNWHLAQQSAMPDTSNASSNISIIFPPGGGTVFLGLTKGTGYQTPVEQIAPN